MSEILKEFEKEFEKIRSELKFKATLQELDDIFFITDHVQKEGFVSKKLSRQISRRIVDMYVSWAQYLHGLLVANPGSLVSMIESQAFSETEKEDITRLLDQLMALSIENNIIGINRNKKQESEFIDKSVQLWKEISPKLESVMKKTHGRWSERSQMKPEKKDKDRNSMYG